MLDEQVNRFLLINPVVQVISFKMRGVSDVTPHKFSLLSRCFVSQAQIDGGQSARQRIRVSVNPTHVPSNAYAMYMPSTLDGIRGDTLYFRTANMFDTSFKRAIVYHELIHALHDASGAGVSQRDGESASWLGEAWFHLECGHDASNPPSNLSTEELEMYQGLTAVFPIASNVRDRFAQSGGTEPAEVSQAERTELRTIMGTLGYERRGRFDMNGVRNHILGRGPWR